MRHIYHEKQLLLPAPKLAIPSLAGAYSELWQELEDREAGVGVIY